MRIFIIPCILLIVTSLLYYGFYILIYKLLKRNSPDGNISKGTYEQRKATTPSRVEKIFDRFDIIYRISLTALFVILISCFFVIPLEEIRPASIWSYIISSDALRFQRYLIEHFFTLIIAILGSVAVFSSINKKKYIFFDIKDVIDVLKIKENIFSLLIYYIFCLLSVMTHYICHYIFSDDIFSNTIKALCFICTIWFSLIVILILIKLFIATINFLLSNYTEQKILDSLYKKIHYGKCLNVSNSDEREINNSFDYLFQNLKPFDKHIKLSFISYVDNYKTFSNWKRFTIFAFTSLIGVCFNLLCVFFFILKNPVFLPSFGTIIVVSVLLNIFGCFVLSLLDSYKIAVQSVLGSWGMMITDKNHKEFFLTCCDSKRNKKYTPYFNKIYNVIYLFKSILDTKIKSSEEYLMKIQKKDDWILYSVCMFLYHKKHPRKKNILKDYCTYIKKEKVKIDILKGNLIAVISDIERYDCENDVNKFINTVIVCSKEKKS